ncbi:hypothetical protein [Streptomyces sp. NPDC059828]|uniref:hypothetical protein n=1 Tax=Streptomyces sp. NPDC059828 TaxID=3346965 RepID=UPI00365820E1
MNVNGDLEDVECKDMYEIGPLTYRQGFVFVWKERFGVREDALMHDRAIVGAYFGHPENRVSAAQLFRAWVDPEELPAVLAHWADILR